MNIPNFCRRCGSYILELVRKHICWPALFFYHLLKKRHGVHLMNHFIVLIYLDLLIAGVNWHPFLLLHLWTWFMSRCEKRIVLLNTTHCVIYWLLRCTTIQSLRTNSFHRLMLWLVRRYPIIQIQGDICGCMFGKNLHQTYIIVMRWLAKLLSDKAFLTIFLCISSFPIHIEPSV